MKRTRTSPRRKKLLTVVGVISFLLLLALVVFTATTQAPEPPKQAAKSTQKQSRSSEKPEVTSVVLQPTVDAWVGSQSGNYGIVVYDPLAQKTIASHQPDEQYFTASIYKLYVAYLTLIDFQAGTADPSEIVLAGQTRKECVYKMIHSSDSPCGETVLNNMGSATLTKRLEEQFGFTGTNFPGFVTTASDTNKLLVRLQEKKDLNDEYTAFLLDAMNTQIYRTGLPQGMPEATIADKVGFDSPDLWMDTGIVTLPNDRVYLVTIYGNGGVGSAQIRSFAAAIYNKLAE